MTPTTTEKIDATVTGFGRIQQSRYSNEQVQSVLFERWDRQDDSRKIWKTFSVPEARLFRKHQHVLLIPGQKGDRQTWAVEQLDEPAIGSKPPYPPRSQYQEPEPETQPASFGGSPRAVYHQQKPRSFAPTQIQTTAAQPPTLSPSQKQEISTWIANQADLYALCFSEAQRALNLQEPQEETVRACASSLFISANRKFRLES